MIQQNFSQKKVEEEAEAKRKYHEERARKSEELKLKAEKRRIELTIQEEQEILELKEKIHEKSKQYLKLVKF